MQENMKIRRLARAAGIPMWRIAAELKVSEPTLTRWLRFPLTEEKERAIKEAIEKLEWEVS